MGEEEKVGVTVPTQEAGVEVVVDDMQ